MILEARRAYCRDCRQWTAHEADKSLWRCPCGKLRCLTIDREAEVSHDGDEKRFWTKVKRTAHCWVWLGKTFNGKHPMFYYRGTTCHPARYAFFLTWGRWPKGCAIKRCQNAWCCNPAHVFEGTREEWGKIVKATGTAPRNFLKRCRKAGHPMTPDNIKFYGSAKQRCCRLCFNRRRREYWERGLGSRRNERRRLARLARRNQK